MCSFYTHRHTHVCPFCNIFSSFCTLLHKWVEFDRETQRKELRAKIIFNQVNCHINYLYISRLLILLQLNVHSKNHSFIRNSCRHTREKPLKKDVVQWKPKRNCDIFLFFFSLYFHVIQKGNKKKPKTKFEITIK